MSKALSCNFSSHSLILDTLKSRYVCVHEPLSLAADATPDDKRYLTSLWVFEDREVDEPESPLPPSFSNLMVDQNMIDPHMIKEKIASALKVLKFRKEHVLVQFWSPVAVKSRWLLKTWDQPFGLGVGDEKLYSYRKESERYAIVADGEHREKLGFSNLMVDQNMIDPHMIKEKIASVLKVLKFRKEHVLVQFWSPVAVKSRWLLTTWDQPFGLGVGDEKLYSYRKESERYAIVADGEHREKLGSPGRVYTQKMPEWSLDVHSQDTCYNIHGYIILPVFESSGDCCVGVLEIITLSSYVDFAFEVHEVSRALKNQNLKSPNVFEDPSVSVIGVPSNLISLRPSIADESRQHELDQIFKVLKTVCDMHTLPLAQVWAPSVYSSYVANSEDLEHSCSSFNRSCIGKACMSTAGLPFYVRDLSVWEFLKACHERHLDKSQGIVGRSFSSCGTWFCKDVTELDENDYPLVHNARMSRLTSCLALYLKSLEADVELVIEFFLPALSVDETVLRRIMETINQKIKNSSWMQLDIVSPPQVIGDVSLNWSFMSPPSPVNLLTENGEVPVPPPESENMEAEPSNSAAGETSQSVVPHFVSGVDDFGINPIKSRRKRKRPERSISSNEISKHFGKTMDEAAAILKVSRSTLKRICRNLGIPRWPYKQNGPDKSDPDALMKSDQPDVIVHKSEGSLTPTSIFGASTSEPFVGTTYITHDHAAVTEYGKHSSTHIPHQHEQSNLPAELVYPETAIKDSFSKTLGNVTIKATHSDNIVKFTYRLSDGLENLKKLVAMRFHLEIGSFSLKYVDEDGDKILIACENDLMGSPGVLSQPESKTVIKLFVDSFSRHTSNFL